MFYVRLGACPRRSTAQLGNSKSDIRQHRKYLWAILKDNREQVIFIMLIIVLI